MMNSKKEIAVKPEKLELISPKQCPSENILDPGVGALIWPSTPKSHQLGIQWVHNKNIVNACNEFLKIRNQDLKLDHLKVLPEKYVEPVKEVLKLEFGWKEPFCLQTVNTTYLKFSDYGMGEDIDFEQTKFFFWDKGSDAKRNKGFEKILMNSNYQSKDRKIDEKVEHGHLSSYTIEFDKNKKMLIKQNTPKEIDEEIRGPIFMLNGNFEGKYVPDQQLFQAGVQSRYKEVFELLKPDEYKKVKKIMMEGVAGSVGLSHGNSLMQLASMFLQGAHAIKRELANPNVPYLQYLSLLQMKHDPLKGRCTCKTCRRYSKQPYPTEEEVRKYWIPQYAKQMAGNLNFKF